MDILQGFQAAILTTFIMKIDFLISIQTFLMLQIVSIASHLPTAWLWFFSIAFHCLLKAFVIPPP